MNFSGLLDAVKNSFLSSPSIVGNVAQGKQWNQDLPRFGGVAPQNQMVQNPNVVSPISPVDEMTPGLVNKSHFEQAIPHITPTPPSTFDNIISAAKIPLQVISGIVQAEGGRIGKNNPANINATDSNPNGAYNYPSPEAGIQALTDLLSKNPRYAKAYALRNDPPAMVKAIQDAGYAGDPKTWRQRSIATGGAGKTFPTWADFVMATKGFQNPQ
jgi:hypothetical protein